MTTKSTMKKMLVTPRVMGAGNKDIKEEGWTIDIGGKPAIAMLSPTLHLRDAQDRIFTDKGRSWNIAAAIASFSATVVELPDDWCKQFLIDGEMLDKPDIFNASNINPVSFNFECRFDDIKRLIVTLRKDKASIVCLEALKTYHSNVKMTFYTHRGTLCCGVGSGAIDIARTYPYETFLTACLVEFVASKVGIPVGDIFYQSPLAYIIEEDFNGFKKLVGNRWPFKANPMPSISHDDLNKYRDLIDIYLKTNAFEKVVNGWDKTPSLNFLKAYALILRAFIYRDSDPVKVHFCHSNLEDPTLKYVLRQWLPTIDKPHHIRPELRDLSDFESIDDV